MRAFSLQRLARKAFFLWLLLLPIDILLVAYHPDGRSLLLRLVTNLLLVLVFAPALYNWLRGRSNEDDQALFLGELSLLTAKELPLDQALTALYNSRRRQFAFRFAAFTPVLGELSQRVHEGASLTEAMRAAPEIPRVWVEMLEEAQARDQVPAVLASLASIANTRLRLPLLTLLRTQFTLVFLLGISFFLGESVVPTFLVLLEHSGLPTKPTTVLLSGLTHSSFMQWVLFPVAVLVATVFLAVPFPKVHDKLRAIAYYLPGFRAALKAEQQTRALASMAAAARLELPLTSLLAAGRSALTIGAYRRALDYQEGTTLSQLLQQKPGLWEPSLVWLSRQGETFDRLPEALTAAVESLERQYRQRSQELVVALDTGVLILMGVAVAIVCLGCVTPYYQFVDAIVTGVLP